MAKKTAKAPRPSQQRSKEEQWRKRMSAQTQSRSALGSALVERDDQAVSLDDESAGDTYARQAAAIPTAAAPAPRPSYGGASAASRSQTQAAAQRRAATAQRASRARLGANTMSITEEMSYIRRDIRKLVVLTAVCVVVLIILSFVVPSIVR